MGRLKAARFSLGNRSEYILKRDDRIEVATVDDGGVGPVGTDEDLVECTPLRVRKEGEFFFKRMDDRLVGWPSKNT